MTRPNTLAEVARRRNEGEELARLLAEFLDEFYLDLASDGAAARLVDAPDDLPDAREHALLGAIGEHLARRWKLPVPARSDDADRFLAMPYFTTPLEGFKALLIAQSPLAFRRRLIFTEAEPLRRARMPQPTPQQG